MIYEEVDEGSIQDEAQGQRRDWAERLSNHGIYSPRVLHECQGEVCDPCCRGEIAQHVIILQLSRSSRRIHRNEYHLSQCLPMKILEIITFRTAKRVCSQCVCLVPEPPSSSRGSNAILLQLKWFLAQLPIKQRHHSGSAVRNGVILRSISCASKSQLLQFLSSHEAGVIIQIQSESVLSKLLT